MRLIILLLTLLTLAGCVTPQVYGNFANNTVEIDQAIAEDALKKFTTLYPPTTRLDLKQPTTDAFGTILVRGLRQQGYALLEYDPEEDASTDSDRPLRYLLDQAGKTNLYRLIILVGNQSIARPYKKQNGMIVPSGYWVHKQAMTLK